MRQAWVTEGYQASKREREEREGKRREQGNGGRKEKQGMGRRNEEGTYIMKWVGSLIDVVCYERVNACEVKKMRTASEGEPSQPVSR